MTPTSKISVAATILIGVCFLHHATTRVQAGPSTSPSARQAARLKYHPPQNWIRHYLPDDRYKVAGGTWKVVSTELDTYFHRPDCPNMLRQPNGIVIGFASAADAVEGGYRPDPVCRAEVPVVTYATRMSQPVRGRGSRRGMGDGGAGAAPVPTSGTITIPTSAIPKHIAAFIGLVDSLADKIESTSSRTELLRLSLRIRGMASDFTNGSVAQHLGGNRVSGNELASMAGILQTLVNAADTKRTPDPLGVFEMAYKPLTDAARSGARDLIPQVAAMRARQPKSHVDALSVYRRYGPARRR